MWSGNFTIPSFPKWLPSLLIWWKFCRWGTNRLAPGLQIVFHCAVETKLWKYHPPFLSRRFLDFHPFWIYNYGTHPKKQNYGQRVAENSGGVEQSAPEPLNRAFFAAETIFRDMRVNFSDCERVNFKIAVAEFHFEARSSLAPRFRKRTSPKYER